MKLEYIQEFLVLAETLNYSRAAEILYSSQSTLSRHISVVEEAVGAQLLIRTTHGAELTEIGEKAVVTFREMLNTYQRLVDTAENRQNQISGKLVIGLMYYTVGGIFSEFTHLLHERYPAITLEFKYFQPHEMYRNLLSGQIDIGNMPKANYPQSDEIRFHKFQKENMVAVMRDDHPLASLDSICLDMIRKETIVELEEDFCSWICTRELMQHAGFVPEKSVMTANIESVPTAVRQTNGIHITGEHCKRQGGRGLKYIDITDPGMKGEMAFLYRMENSNPLVPIFLRELDHFFAHVKN